jgi:hypothetical protein
VTQRITTVDSLIGKKTLETSKKSVKKYTIETRKKSSTVLATLSSNGQETTDCCQHRPQIRSNAAGASSSTEAPPPVAVRRDHRRVRDARSASKMASSQGSVMAASWSKPNSSSANRSRTRKSGCSRHAMGRTKRHRLSPTYTGKWPLGTPTSC